MQTVIRWFVNALSLYIVANVIPGIAVRDFGAALVAAVVIGLVNALIKPVLVVLTLPITILTLGLFTFVINALLLKLAGSVTPGFTVASFGSAFVGSIVLSIVSTILTRLTTHD